MPNIRLLKTQDYRVVPWKNHRGTTSEIAIWPEGADFHREPFLWRVSSAQIASSGLFSQFPAYDRVITVLEGEQMELNHGFKNAPDIIRTLQPHGFKGEWETACEIGDRPVRDFNLMVRRGKIGFKFEVLDASCLDGSPLVCEARWVIAYCVSDSVAFKWNTERFVLAANDTLVFDNEKKDEIRFSLEKKDGDPKVILIRLSPSSV